jgi:hypothetical protein
MVKKEFIVTGQLQDADGQSLILHGSFFESSREQAIEKFHEYFEPDLKVLKIYSVVNEQGQLV